MPNTNQTITMACSKCGAFAGYRQPHEVSGNCVNLCMDCGKNLKTVMGKLIYVEPVPHRDRRRAR